VNLKDTIPWVLSLAQLGSTRVPPEVRDNLRPLRTLMAYGTHDGATSRFTLFLEVK
jgi:hypothetical protein